MTSEENKELKTILVAMLDAGYRLMDNGTDWYLAVAETREPICIVCSAKFPELNAARRAYTMLALTEA